MTVDPRVEAAARAKVGLQDREVDELDREVAERMLAAADAAERPIAARLAAPLRPQPARDGEPEWDYWCPAAGTHVVAPNELHVGIVVADAATGTFEPLFVAAIIPPLPTEPPSQNEAFAQAVRLALAGEPIAEGGTASWCAAHGFSIPWPAARVAADAVERPVAQRLAETLRSLVESFHGDWDADPEPDIGARLSEADRVLAEWDATQEQATFRPVRIPRDPAERAALCDESDLTAEERDAIEAWVKLQPPDVDQYTLDDPPPWINKHRYGPS